MSKKNLVICDKMLRYASGLGENISARNEFSLRVQICTGPESVWQFRKDRDIHILIVDEAFSYQERKEMNAEHTFVLTKEKCRDLGNEETEIYKFQSANKIFAKVLETYFNRTDSSILKGVKSQKTTLIAVYSPIHRVGKTTFAIALGKEIAKTQRTLYLNLEERADVDERFVRAEGRNLGDLFYYMHQEEIHVPLRIAAMVAQIGNLDYIPPFLMSGDIKGISSEDWQKLLKIIFQGCSYETVILDLSDCVNGLFELLECCDVIYMPVLEDGISKQKLSMFEEEIKKVKPENIWNRVHRFTAEEDMAVYVRKLILEEKQDGKVGGTTRENFRESGFVAGNR